MFCDLDGVESAKCFGNLNFSIWDGEQVLPIPLTFRTLLINPKYLLLHICQKCHPSIFQSRSISIHLISYNRQQKWNKITWAATEGFCSDRLNSIFECKNFSAKSTKLQRTATPRPFVEQPHSHTCYDYSFKRYWSELNRKRKRQNMMERKCYMGLSMGMETKQREETIPAFRMCQNSYVPIFPQTI